ncbi:hypothetical protein QL285_034543 [Trifolium repens]|jgi:hypothetical protein|nr:hypothetical protein QL285_034543 [Trifolium repens]
METRCKGFEIDKLKFKLGFSCGIVVDCRGLGRERAGGLALFWKDQLDISIKSYSLNHIYAKCVDVETNEAWDLTGIYGYPEEHNKRKTWQLIRQLHSEVGSMWLCFGDLNDIISAEEKKGGLARSHGQLEVGRQAVLDCHLTDLGFEGYPLTWSNGRHDNDNIQCRLDRVMASDGFINRFSPIRVLHLPRYGSDHAALIITLEAPSQQEQRRRKRIFRFEESWTGNARCESLIKACWSHANTSCSAKLNNLQNLGKELGDHTVGSIRKEIVRIEKILQDHTMWDDSGGCIQRYKDLEFKLGELLKEEEIMWRQRSRALWLRNGDKNTKKNFMVKPIKGGKLMR